MKKLILLLMIGLWASNLPAATWYATSSSANMSAITWDPTTTGSCTGSGTPLSWGSQANGDTFDANGCTAIAINTDPGGTSVEVTLTNPTHGGAFTYATATNITIHANFTAGTVTLCAVTGSTGGLTIIGNINGSSTNAIATIADSHTSVTVTVTGNLAGGSGGGFAYYHSSTGPVSITGNATAGANNGAYGLDQVSGSSDTINGNCTGANGSYTVAGCYTNSNAAHLTVTGNIISGLFSPGATGPIIWAPAASTNYMLFPADTSYTVGSIDSHAIEIVAAPAVGNVKSGVTYGTLTGTLSAGGQHTCTQAQ